MTQDKKKPYFHCGSLSRESSKSTKIKPKEMLLEPNFVMEYNNNNNNNK